MSESMIIESGHKLSKRILEIQEDLTTLRKEPEELFRLFEWQSRWLNSLGELVAELENYKNGQNPT